MPVITAEALVAQSKAVKTNGTAPTLRRDRKQNPNPSTAGGGGGAKARMPYYIPGPQPIPRRSARPAPRSGSSAVNSSQDSVKADGSPKPETTETPPGQFSEYTLVSAAPDDWKYSIMTFRPANKDAKVDIKTFQEPIKLNRKNPPSIIYAEMDPKDVKATPLVPMLGPDGQPVYHNGEIVMVNAEGQTTISAAKAKNAKGKGKAVEAVAPGKKKGPNKPKTRQTFKASEEVRARRKEEYHPWVLEDATSQQDWIGTMDGRNDDGIYGIFMIDRQKGVFEFVPLHRYYDFKPKRQITASVRAEEAHEKHTSGKRFDMVAAFAARNGGKVSNATRRTQMKVEKMEAEDVKPLVKREARDDDDDLFGEKRKGDMEGDPDEFEYEENMADDEEGDRHEEIAEDEEEKRTQERLKREYMAANKLGNGEIEDDDDDLDFEDLLNADGKRLKNVLRKAGEFDDSDDDDDDYYGKRYGVKKEEEDTSLPMATGVQEQPRKVPKQSPVPPKPSAATTSSAMVVDSQQSTSNPGGSTPSKAVRTPPVEYSGSAPNPQSRATSPPVPSGSAFVAMRATSPKRTNLPLSRGSTPAAARVGSPLAQGARAASPSTPAVVPANAATVNAKKRKDAPTASSTSLQSGTAAAAPSPGGPVTKKKKLSPDNSTTIQHPSIPIPTVADVVQFIQSNGGKVSAKDLALRFKTKDSKEVKNALIALVKQIGKMEGVDGTQYVTLKPGYG
ncbi:hypothetical protein FRB99_005422 [Tulasnella sp. 403]|nr:hypothetical protein FRB99_005422 [Tulasnella sp. 403]